MMYNRLVPAGGWFMAVILSLTAASFAERPEPKITMVQDEPMYTVLKPGDIPALSEPEFIPVSRADDYYYSDEPLIAVIDGATAKGYSTWHLDRHEVVNDYINGKAITVTW